MQPNDIVSLARIYATITGDGIAASEFFPETAADPGSDLMRVSDIHIFRLNYPRPSKGLHANDRVRWRRKAKSSEEIRQEVMLRVRSLRL